MRPEAYGERIADVYDGWYDGKLDSDAAAALLAKYAGTGPVLELGVGTGRIALRLAHRGHRVTGIDISDAMLAKLREKDPDGLVRAVCDDMLNLDRTGESYSLIYVVFSGLFGLKSHEEQCQLFRASARALLPDGRLVVEAHVPSVKGLATSGEVRLARMTESTVVLEVMQLDEAQQRVDIQLIEMTEAGTKLYPSSLRYAYQGEMELMATSAGLSVDERLLDWNGTPAAIGKLPSITVYRRPAKAS